MASPLRFSDDPCIKDIRNAIQGTVVRKTSSRFVEIADHQPNSHKTIFEGSVEETDMLVFKEYTGPCQEQHKNKEKTEPQLENPSPPTSDQLIQFKELFNQQRQLIREKYTEDLHGKWHISGCFGQMYIFDNVRHPRMDIKKFHELAGPRATRRFHASFYYKVFPAPQKTASHLEKHIQEHGYVLDEGRDIVAETHYQVSVLIVAEKSRYSCQIILDENGKFLEFRYPPVKWIVFVLKRADKTLPDIRFMVDSLRSVTEQTDPAVAKYKDQELIQFNEDGSVSLNPAYPECERLAKYSRKCYKKKGAATSQLDARIIIQEYTQYVKPIEGGDIQLKAHQEEILIEPKTWDYEEFPVDYVEL